MLPVPMINRISSLHTLFVAIGFQVFIHVVKQKKLARQYELRLVPYC